MERGAAAKAFRIPVSMFLKFFYCPLLAIVHLHQRKMMANHFLSLAQRGRGIQPEYPGVPQRPSTDHHSIAACLFQHLPGQQGCGYISVSNDRDADGFLHSPDQVPICPASIPLNLCPRMDGDGIDAAILRDF